MRHQPLGLSSSLTLMFTGAVKGSASEHDSVGGNAGGDAVLSMNPPVCIVVFSCFGPSQKRRVWGRTGGWGVQRAGVSTQKGTGGTHLFNP